jgi:mono/diheme cytochrome c family protein
MIRLQITIGLLLILAAMTVILIIGITEPARLEATTAAQQGRAIEVGAKLFETNCSGCHGIQGEGIAGLCPPLNDPTFFQQRLKEVGYPGSLHDYIAATVSGGRLVSTRPDKYAGKMPPWSQAFGGPLRADQIEDIAQFILNWQKTATGEVKLAPTPTPAAAAGETPEQRGLAVFNTNGCSGCHTIQGVSNGVVGPNLSKIGTDAAEIIKQPGYTGQAKAPEDFIRESIVNPNAYVAPNCPGGPCQPNIMPGTFGQTIQPAALDDLVKYLSSLK